MAILRLEIEVEYDPEIMHGAEPDELAWFRDSVLMSPSEGEELVLHSNCIGDAIGVVRKCRIIGEPL
jgi:hypothetical protein